MYICFSVPQFIQYRYFFYFLLFFLLSDVILECSSNLWTAAECFSSAIPNTSNLLVRWAAFSPAWGLRSSATTVHTRLLFYPHSSLLRRFLRLFIQYTLRHSRAVFFVQDAYQSVTLLFPQMLLECIC